MEVDKRQEQNIYKKKKAVKKSWQQETTVSTCTLTHVCVTWTDCGTTQFYAIIYIYVYIYILLE